MLKAQTERVETFEHSNGEGRLQRKRKATDGEGKTQTEKGRPSNSTWTWCCATYPSLAFQLKLDATLLDLLLRFDMNLMLRYLLDLSSDSTFTWRYEFGSSLAFHHELDAALLDLLLRFNMNLILPYLIFSSISTWTWCRATWAPLAIQHELDATLRDLLLRFDMSLMLRYLIFSSFSTWTWCLSTACSSTWTSWCFAAWQFAVQHEVDATLLDLFLQFTANLMLRCSLFSCVLIWIWCYVAWSSLAVHRERDVTLLDLLIHFIVWRYATWLSFVFNEFDAMLLDLLLVAANGRLPQNQKVILKATPLEVVIGRWIWAKHVMVSLVFDSILSDQLTLCCASGEFFCQRARPPNLESDYPMITTDCQQI